MPVSDIIKNGTGRLTNQQIADFMLEADRMLRKLLRENRKDEAAEVERELASLAAAIQ